MNVHQRVDVGYQTHPGQVRQRNEDNLGLPPPNLSPEVLAAKGYLYLVADGMGGYQGGQRASQIAVQRIVQEYYQDPSPDLKHSLARAIRLANAQIYQEAQRSPELQKMGTTVTAAVVRGHDLLVANVGDSRTYLVRGGVARQLTEDHSLIAQGLKQGTITPDQAEKHPYRGVITRVLGGEPDVQPDFFREQLQPGDAVLLCSDGVSNEVDDRELAIVVGRRKTAQEAANRLIDLANQHGGRDNATAIVVSVDGRQPGGMTGLPPWLLPLAGGLVAVALVFIVLLAFPGHPIPVATPGTTPLATPQTFVAQVATTAAPTISIATLPSEIGKCGDGTCDQEEQVNQTRCPVDCAAELTAMVTATQIPPTVETPTETASVSSTTVIPSPTATRTPRPTKTNTPPTSTPKPPTAMPALPPPTLLSPPNGTALTDEYTFEWMWTGELGQGLGFALQMSVEQDKGFETVLSPDLARPQGEGKYAFLSVNVKDLPFIAGKSGPFYWRIVLVDRAGKILAESQSWQFSWHIDVCAACRPCRAKCPSRVDPAQLPPCCTTCCPDQGGGN